MFFKVLRDIAKPQWFDIISTLKKSTGLSVAELSESLGMSYMGVKQHCVELTKRGYLDTWRRPKAVGRPEKAYRLTSKAEPLFVELGADFILGLLKNVDKTYGASAAEKLLFGYFHEIGAQYQKRVKGETLYDRTVSFSKIRDLEGCLSSCEIDSEGSIKIIEYHSPYRRISSEYSMIYRMEEQMIAKVLGANVSRNEEEASGLLRCEFRIN
ncbi:MAG: winged helix-turn-helix transcriptional regulator [Akkermansiaceae bacterium]|jgi:predicted ArsR family transcriptional regulator|nr:winged helix-turn-helix transcriptional regulator [Akkermansiaceae bacterium]MDG1853806.1 winged helix-turn-helix transcriptional regulator [Verrucomicrobiales bacterium]